jgi:hypothetical protein
MAGYDDFSSPVQAQIQGNHGSAYDAFSSPMQQEQPESWGQYAKGLGREALSGATFGFGNKILAGIQSPFSDQNYSDILKGLTESSQKFEEKHPYVSAAAEVAGAVPSVLSGGEALAAAPLIGKGVQAVSRGIESIPYWLPRVAARGAAVGAPYGALSEIGQRNDLSSLSDYLEAAKTGAEKGAIGAAALTPALEGAGRAVASTVGPWASKEALGLIKKGIPLTAGETMGGPAKTIEDYLSRLPIGGIAVRNAQERSIEGLNRAAVNETLAPIGETLSKATAVGHDAIAEAETKIKGSYDSVLNRMAGKVDDPLKKSISEIRDELTPSMTEAFDKIIDRNVVGAADPVTGELSGARLKRAFSALTNRATTLNKDTDAFKKELGQSLFDAKDALLEMAERHNNPGLVRQLKDTNAAFARLVRIQKAASKVGTDEFGVFTPAQLHNAVIASDQSARKAAVSKGQALMQDLSGPAKGVMSSVTPNSGTPERMRMNLLLEGILGGGAGLSGGFPAVATMEGAPWILYSRPVQDLLRKAMTAAPESRQAIANTIRGLAQKGAPAAAAPFDRSVDDLINEALGAQ